MIDDFIRPGKDSRNKVGADRNSLYSRFNGVQPNPQMVFPSNAAEQSGTTPAAYPGPSGQFRTPEQVAAATHDYGTLPAPIEEGTHGPESAGSPVHQADPGTPRKPKKPARTVRLFGKWEISRKKLIVIICIIVALLAAGGAAAYVYIWNKPEPVKPKATVAKKVDPPPPPPIVSPLTGAVVTAEQRDRPVVGVMIENSPDARPQSGLQDAGVVFEAIAEAGITRFLALYQEQDTANIGPIRSSRPYYLDWAMAYDAAYAHVGGSPDALARIKAIGVKDMDQFHNSGSYRRITTRYAPHNVYSTVPGLRQLAISKNYATSTYTPIPRKADVPYKAPDPNATTPAQKAKQDKRVPATSMDFTISGAYYNAHFDYDPMNNNYGRVMAGKPHIDDNSKAQIKSKVVMALVMPYSLMADGYHSQYNTIGSGKMFLFQDGTVTTGTWTKGEPKTQFVFKDDAGKEVSLNTGNTWVTIVGDPAKVTYR